MSPVGDLVIVAAIAFGLSVSAIRFTRKVGRLSRRRPMKVKPPERRDEIVGDGAWNITPGKFPPRSARVRDHEPRGM